MINRAVRKSAACALIVLLMACAREPVNEPAKMQSASTDSSVRHFDNRPAPLPPDEIHYGALTAATPAQIRTLIDRHGAAPVIRSLWGERTDQGWRRVEEGVARGDQAWLDVVPALRSAADGAVAEQLHVAVSDALPDNAAGVLRLVTEDDPVSAVCAMNRIEPTQEEYAAYFAAAIPAVEAVRDADLQIVKAQCLDSLRRARSGRRY